MASWLDQDFPDEEEDDFNPQAEVASDDEADEKPQLNGDAEDEDDDVAPQRSRSRSRQVNDEVKDEDEDKDDDVDLTGGDDDQPVEVDGDDHPAVGDEDDEEVADQDDEEDEEEEEDEDDDLPGRPAKKRRKNRRNQFIDVEAEVDEDDEEEPEEEDDLPGDEMHPDDLQELPADADRDDRKHRELDRQREAKEQETAEEQAQRFVERYGRKERAGAATGAVVPQRLLLPGPEDPHIFRLKCRPGKERDVIQGISLRMAERQYSREPILINSAFERGGVMAGNLYVEARRQEDVVAAVEGLTHVFSSYKPLMIPIEEMPDLLKIKKSSLLEPGMYVRVRKTGWYQGDLAQVEDVESNGVDVTLRLIPRLTYGLTEDTNAPAVLDQNGKRKRTKTTQPRPPAKHFSETEAKKKLGRYLSRAQGLGNNAFTFENEDYVDGFLIKNFRINQLQRDNVNPTLEEVTKFASGGEDGTENLDLNALAATIKQTKAEDYLPGDKVEIFRGEQKGVTGKSVEVYGDVVKMRVDSAGALRGQVIEAPIKDLRKLFREGDHVKVIGGSKYVDEVGMVVKSKDDRVTLLTDSNNQEITVFSKDLREATDAGGNVAGSKFDLFDLVQLDVSTVGCVIKVDRESLRVLDQNGSIRSMLPSAISNKLERRRNAVATDSNGNEMKIDDTIKEFGGEQRQGRVLHLHRNFVFVQNRERVENAGVWVARHMNVTTLNAKGGRPGGQNGVDLTRMNPAMKQNGVPGVMAPPQGRGRDRLIGKTVKLRSGNQKGMIGIVKDATDQTVKVELHAKNKVISINRDHLQVIDPRSGQPIDDRGRPGGGMPGRTPAPGAYGRTPFGGPGAEGRTPAYAMAGGGRTPTWKQDVGSRTPGYGGATAYGGGGFGGTTAYGGQTSYGGGTSYGGATTYGGGGGGGGSVWGGNQSTWNPNPSSRTPAHNPGNKTPAYSGGLEAPTPGFSAPTPGDQPTPGGFRGQYQTPAAYQTPGGFPETPGAGFDDDGPRYD
ncbi:transcription elongation factor spt5 [Saxophila tyrrhenica]|uniref:Transcription elongation factor SPT5 n=1 Tax=Saxophila tyrrhenica TaxID=1690608 RepID=A0AAV9NW96_9PEZI|nr:transcription elongation factor spt5 [Saxophila tyrrhenica]